MASSNKYDVFISFRGEDTRDNFTSHLYDALTRNKIHTFIDDTLQRGDEISPALRKAIEGSELSVIIFSENFASSTWCLEELVHILEWKKKHGQIAIPVFYGVDPSRIRKQKGSYAAAFAQLEERFGFGNRLDKVHQWRAALTEAANLSWDSLVTKPESKLIEKIVQDILKKLYYKLPISELKGLVGIEERIKKIESLLCIDSRDVRVIGIWGMGGIRKTTLAAAVFRRLYSQFESCYFLANVREESEKRGLNHLREKLISELLEEEETNKGSPLVEYGSIEYRLRQKKVFIVVDDVNNSSQIELLVGDRDRFGYGSRIIVTARNVQVLRKVAADIYKVEGLNDSEAFDLLCSNAFKGNTVGTEHSVLSHRVVNYARGNPLAIKVLGSVLYSKSKEEWKNALDKLETVPNKDILNVLRISYGELDHKEQDIFLDIACFFKGDDVDFVERILDGCGFFARTGIQNLIDKSLVNIIENKLWMQDLLQEMGREIVREESIKQPGDCSRLWRIENIHHVLTRNTGSAKVEGIFLNTSEMKEITLRPEVFSKMHNLRLLKIYNFDEEQKCKLKFPQGLQCLPDALTYLYWDGYPLKSLPSDFSPENIVVLQMPNSQLEQLWDGIQELGKLREMDLSHSKHLTKIPNLSHASNLETINLEYCISLFQLPPTLQYHSKLSSLNLRCCSKLEKLPELPRNIKELVLEGCTEIIEMPSSIGSLDKLESLNLHNCKALMNLPSNTSNLDSLKSLNLSACTSIDMFPSLPRFLNRLDISGTRIKAVPSSIDQLSGLVKFYLIGCKRLESLPTSICKLRALTFLSLSGCSKLRYFPEISEPMECLRFLHLGQTGIKELPFSIGSLSGLEELNLEKCWNLEALPDSINKLNNIENFSLFGCSKLEKFPILSTSLATSDVWKFRNLDFKFFNCIKLDHEARRGIMADVHIRILHMAAFTLKAKKEFQFFASPSLRICCPGNEIPDWFTYQSKGSSLNIQLPLNRDSNLLGFALCAVVAFRKCRVGRNLSISCKCSLKRKNDKCQNFNWSTSWQRRTDSKISGIANSDHMFLWYDHSIFEHFIGRQAYFLSSTCNATFSFHSNYDSLVIKKCGICLLYAQDAERFGILDQDVLEPDVAHNITKRSRDEFEASGSVIVISSDEEEEEDDQPNPKRI